MTEAINRGSHSFSPAGTALAQLNCLNMPLARLIWPLHGQCTKKGLGTINKENTREIELKLKDWLCPYRNFSQAIISP